MTLFYSTDYGIVRSRKEYHGDPLALEILPEDD